MTRAGFAAALGKASGIQLVAALDHEEAARWPGDWSSIDVVLVDAADEGRVGDQFPGVTTVRQIRTATVGDVPLVAVVTGHALHEGLRYRMAEAGADFLFARSDLRTSDSLVGLVLEPDSHRRGSEQASTLPEDLGLGADTDIEAIVTYVEGHGLGAALDPDSPRRADPRSRRWLRHRQALAAAGKIDPVNLTTGNPARHHRAPSLHQLRRIWAWAARITDRK